MKRGEASDSAVANLEALQPLDLCACKTVSDIVEGMRHCSFGARMLGEVAHTLAEWVDGEKKPLVIFGGRSDTPLGKLLESMHARGWFRDILSPQYYGASRRRRREHVLVVGGFTDQDTPALFGRPERAIFINPWGLAPPEQAQDGYFHDVLFSDPLLIMQILENVLTERREGFPVKVSALLECLSRYGGVASAVSHGAAVLEAMVADPDCTVFLTISGAMTIAKMGLVICDMIDLKMVRHLTTTGALMAHGLIENMGLPHLRYDPRISDKELAELKLNRITNVLEPESNFDELERRIIYPVLDECAAEGAFLIGSGELYGRIGKFLSQHFPEGRGILKSAFERGVPVYTPAFWDSEIGNNVFHWNRQREERGEPRIVLDLERDVRRLVEAFTKTARVGIFTIGGGVPRNTVQNTAPLLELMHAHGLTHFPIRQIWYGCRICPDPMWLGHLSGCTYSEGGSWRKIDPKGLFAEVLADATVVWPFLVKHIMDQAERGAITLS